MPRAISIASALVALVFLVLVLADATLVDRRPPSVTGVRLSATAGGDRIAEPITSINVVFSEAVKTATAEPRFHLTPAVPGALSWDGPTLIFTPSAPLPAATDFVVAVDPGYEDLAGNVAATGIEDWAFATAGPPRVLAFQPQDAAVGIAIDSTVEIEFDRLMDTTSVERAIALSPRAGFRASWSGASVVLTFEAGLAFGTAYTLELDSSAADTAGAHLIVPFVMHFTTVAAGLDARVVPANDVAGIAIRSPIAVLFDGPIDPDSATGALSITPPVGGNTQVVADPNGGPASVLVFRPSSPLAENTTYTVTLAPVIHKLDDPGQVAAGRTWSFTTGSETESAQNQVAFLSERSGVTNVWLVNPDGTNARQLTWELVDVTTFDVTGDGRRLVYAAGGVVATLSVDGTDPQVVTKTGRTESAPRLSPDETHLLVSRRDANGADLGWWLVPSPWTFGDERQVLPTGAPDLDRTTRSSDIQPVFEPSGRYALIPTRPAAGLVSVDLAIAGDDLPPAISTGVTAFGSPTWSAADAAFAVAGMASGGSTPGLQLVATDGSMTSIGVTTALGDVSADAAGNLLYIHSFNARLILELQGHGDRETTDLTDDQAYDDLGATFSPDGRRIVVARAFQGSGRTAGLWLLTLDDRQPTQLTIDGSDPRWLP